jgi:hypothetical protein
MVVIGPGGVPALHSAQPIVKPKNVEKTSLVKTETQDWLTRHHQKIREDIRLSYRIRRATALR